MSYTPLDAEWFERAGDEFARKAEVEGDEAAKYPEYWASPLRAESATQFLQAAQICWERAAALRAAASPEEEK